MPKDLTPSQYADTRPQIYTDEDERAGRLEQRKAIFEFLRHVMTLDSLALVLVATLIEKVFSQPIGRGYVGSAVVAFLASLVGGVISYLNLLGNPPKAGTVRMPLSDERFFVVTTLVAFIGFIAGMVGVAGFFVANWFR